jgi:hypothetical protein
MQPPMIAALCVKLDISERVREALPETTATREAKTNTKIVALLKTGLSELKHCRNEQQRIQCWPQFSDASTDGGG